jgi:hypothetical protein
MNKLNQAMDIVIENASDSERSTEVKGGVLRYHPLLLKRKEKKKASR